MRINGQPLFRSSIWDYARARKLYSAFVRGRSLAVSTARSPGEGIPQRRLRPEHQQRPRQSGLQLVSRRPRLLGHHQAAPLG